MRIKKIELEKLCTIQKDFQYDTKNLIKKKNDIKEKYDTKNSDTIKFDTNEK